MWNCLLTAWQINCVPSNIVTSAARPGWRNASAFQLDRHLSPWAEKLAFLIRKLSSAIHCRYSPMCYCSADHSARYGFKVAPITWQSSTSGEARAQPALTGGVEIANASLPQHCREHMSRERQRRWRSVPVLSTYYRKSMI